MEKNMNVVNMSDRRDKRAAETAAPPPRVDRTGGRRRYAVLGADGNGEFYVGGASYKLPSVPEDEAFRHVVRHIFKHAPRGGFTVVMGADLLLNPASVEAGA